MKKFRYLPLLALAVLLGLSACTDEFEELNENTKSAKELEVKFLLPTAESILMNHYMNYDVNSNVTVVQAQHFSQADYSDESNFHFRDGLTDSYIGDYYTVLLNLHEIDQQVKSSPDAVISKEAKTGWNLMVTTLKAFAFQCITDTNGPAMFKEAFNLEDKTPAYSSQEEIYKTLLADLYKAISQVEVSAQLDLGEQDIIYNGNLESWRKFGNSMLLRLAMRIADVAPALSKDYFNKAVNENGGVFLSNKDNALFHYLPDTPNGNPIFESVFQNGVPITSSNTIMDIQNATNDPRKWIFWTPGYDGSSETYSDWNGLAYGQSGAWWDFPYPNRGYTGRYSAGKSDAPGVFIDYAEVEFFLAEAVLRGGYNVSGTANEHYNKAIEASIRYNAEIVEWSEEGINSSVANYLAEPLVDLNQATTTQDKLYRIGREKWIALFWQGPEAWAEVRRLDAPAMNVPDGKTAADVPTRIIFSSREKVINGANVNAAAQLLKGGKDTYTAKLWWDTK
ncbi:MAG: SusD/RagB family nutrient-binding outer membrane lipoprotein [Marinifilaceae bacterium]